MTTKTIIKKLKQKRFSFVHLGLAVVVVVLLGGVMMYLQSSLASTPVATTNYDDCVKQGGHLTSYDGAIQFDACVTGNDQLSLQYSAQNMPRIDEHKVTATANNVVSSASDPADLVAFLKYDDTGCASSGSTGYYKILKVVPNRFAMMNYGCDNYTADQKAFASIIAMKLGGSWALLSPTNNMNEQGLPSCLLVDMFRISKDLSSQCYQNTGYSDNTLRQVTYQ